MMPLARGGWFACENGVIDSWRWVALAVWATWVTTSRAHAQIGPVKRDLVQFGYNAALEGHTPLSAYAFHAHNRPGFLSTKPSECPLTSFPFLREFACGGRSRLLH
jgi:hypothetical protein